MSARNRRPRPAAAAPGRSRTVLVHAALVAALTWVPAACDRPDRPAASTDGSSDGQLSLDREERERLWAIEHHGNVLTQLGFAPMVEAAARQDGEAVAEPVAEDFTARLAALREAELELDEVLHVQRYHGHDEPATHPTLDRAGFVDWMLQLLAPFDSEPKVKLGIKSLGPVSHDDWDGPWEGRFVMDLAGTRSGQRPYNVSLKFTAHVDRPGRGRIDEPGWLRRWTVEQVTVGEAERYLFREVAAEWGVDTSRFYDNWKEDETLSNTGSAYSADFDRDGYLDLMITDVAPPGVMMLAGGPDGFRDVTDEMGMTTAEAGLTAAFVDLENDGWPDLVFESGRIFRNVEGRRFEQIVDQSNLHWLLHGPEAPGPAVSSIVPADFDRDGSVDLYVTRGARGAREDAGWLEDSLDPESGNQLLQNLGNWQFRDVSRYSGAGAGGRSTFSAAWLDADGDGWPDLYVINEFGDGVLLVNQGDGRFAQQPLAGGRGDFGSMGVVAGDIDNDGHIDIFTSNMYSKAGNRIMDNLRPGSYSDEVMQRLRRLVDGSQLYRNLGDLEFERVGQQLQVRQVGWSWGAALADFTNDGWLDLYATSGYVSRDRARPDG